MEVDSSSKDNLFLRIDQSVFYGRPECELSTTGVQNSPGTDLSDDVTVPYGVVRSYVGNARKKRQEFDGCREGERSEGLLIERTIK